MKMFAATCVLSVATLSAQSAATVTEAQAREWAAYANDKAAGDPKAFDATFVTLARILAPAYRADPFSAGVVVYRTDALEILTVGPVSAFQLNASESVRKMSSVEKVPWGCGVEVMVVPSRIDALDIETIVVRRSGVIIVPTSTTLTPRQMATRGGSNVTLHAGSVCYPLSAFAPGAPVTVIAIPATGENIIKTLRDRDLMMIV